MRVVSVLPSATEIVYALGHGPELVGRSAECDHPHEVTRLPVVMRARTLDSDRPSAEIDARVRTARARNESLYELDIEGLRALRPELLLTQDLCGVCSVTPAQVVEACARAGVAPRVVSLTPRTLEEVWATIPIVAEALGDPESGHRLLSTIRKGLPPLLSVARRPRVALIEWVDPPILAGLWASEIVTKSGGEFIGPAPGTPGERTSWEEIRARRPELVIISPCSFAVPRTLAELARPSPREGLSTLSPELGTFVADEAYFSRPGPRLADGVRLVYSLLHGGPSRFPMAVERWSPDSSPGAFA
jgi:iron complex transport system substrate-binding protein